MCVQAGGVRGHDAVELEDAQLHMRHLQQAGQTASEAH